jgi:hypothetical protein
MFKKTVLTMALVLMATSAFAATDPAHDREDAARATEARDGIAAKNAAANKAADIDSQIKILVGDSNPGEATALKKAAGVTLTSDGKSLSGSDVVKQLADIKQKLTASGQLKSKQKELDTVTAFVAKMSHISEGGAPDSPLVLAREAYMKEVTLTLDILETYTPAELASHIKFQSDVLKEYAKTGKMDESLLKKLSTDCNGDAACIAKKAKEIKECKRG